MAWKILKIAVALFFAPMAVTTTRAFLLALEGLSAFSAVSLFLAAGFFAYTVFHIVFFKPMRIYAFGHEIVHVLATWLSGGKVISFKISKNGGSVATTKTNAFIRLSPYFVPIYTIFLSFAYWIFTKVYGASGFFNQFIFLMGLTMSFHIFMTIEVMKLRQPDIVKTGYFFSVLFIYVTNVIIALFILSLVFSDISFVNFAKDALILSKNIYLGIFNRLLG